MVGKAEETEAAEHRWKGVRAGGATDFSSGVLQGDLGWSFQFGPAAVSFGGVGVLGVDECLLRIGRFSNRVGELNK